MMTRQFPASADRQVALGAACWVLTVVFFVGQAVAQAASTVPYSLAGNNISDLGNTACGTFTQGAYRADVCSPLHGVMNATFALTGLLMLSGAVGTRRAWPRRRLTTAGLVMLVLAGAGEVLVGFRPENVSLGFHALGAVFGIAGANVGVLLLAVAVWRTSPWTAILSLVVGVLGLVSFLLFVSAQSLGLGTGLVERLAGYPVVVWMIVVGCSLLWSGTWSDRPGAHA
ncbi:DUF998 domain-containing protein [Candidatus Nephthysia bennettiae]